MDKDIEDMVQRSDFVRWGVLKFIGSERKGTKNTCPLELKSAFDVEYSLINQLLFLGSDDEDDDEEEEDDERPQTGATSNQDDDEEEDNS
jgi:hypothetical protein